MEMREDSYVYTVPVKHESYASSIRTEVDAQWISYWNSC